MAINSDFLEQLRLVAREPHSSLSRLFEQVRSDCSAQVQQILLKLEDDHPLFSPITLFGTVEYGRLEIAYTRALAWLFNPQQPHGYRDTIVAEVLRKFLQTETQILTAVPEYRLSLRQGQIGRIDIWLEGSLKTARGSRQHLIAIEAKIDSPDDMEQLKKYHDTIDRQKGARKDFLFLSPGQLSL